MPIWKGAGPFFVKNFQRKPSVKKRQFLINELIGFGIYKKNNKHLYEWSLSELETEYIYNETNSFESKSIKIRKNRNLHLK